MPSIQLQSSDGEIFKLDVEIAKLSNTIKTMLDDLGIDEDEEEIVPLPNVNAAILKKVWIFNETYFSPIFELKHSLVGKLFFYQITI